VYVHCKAGHGRGAAVAYCWLAYQNKNMSPKAINELLSSKRKVRKSLYKQKSILAYLKTISEEK
jgi:atypical dual specificity phosphatase